MPQQRSEETRTRLLEAALQLFSKNGYDATGVAEICTAAGVIKGAFYHHFPSKHAVFMALLDGWLESLNREFAGALVGAKDIPTGLVAMAAKASIVFQDARGHLPMFLEFWTKAARDPDVWQTTIEPYRRYQTLFAGIIRQGIAEGSLADNDPDAVSRVVLALALGLVLQSILDRDSTHWEQVAQQGMLLMMKGLAK
jgi:AcrR family transcriptional regulator